MFPGMQYGHRMMIPDPAGFWKTAGAGFMTAVLPSVGFIPYMLHREPDEHGNVDWRQFSGLDQHGEYDAVISDDESLDLARETKEYENAFLTQEIQFLEFMQDYFTRHRLRHVQKVYDDQIRQV